MIEFATRGPIVKRAISLGRSIRYREALKGAIEAEGAIYGDAALLAFESSIFDKQKVFVSYEDKPKYCSWMCNLEFERDGVEMECWFAFQCSTPLSEIRERVAIERATKKVKAPAVSKLSRGL
jgi:hypothetical protein